MRRNALGVVIGGCVPPKSLSFEHSLRAFVRCPIAHMSCSHVANEMKGRLTFLSCRADVLSRAATSVYVITFWVDLKGKETLTQWRQSYAMLPGKMLRQRVHCVTESTWA